VLQAQSGDSFGDTSRLIPVDWLWFSFGHCAKSAAPRADVAQQHEGCSFVVPALTDVRTLRRLAHGMQAKTTRQLFQIMKVISNRSLRPQPRRLGGARRRRELNLNQLGSGRHPIDFNRRIAFGGHKARKIEA
jgi:hypothetical protein